MHRIRGRNTYYWRLFHGTGVVDGLAGRGRSLWSGLDDGRCIGVCVKHRFPSNYNGIVLPPNNATDWNCSREPLSPGNVPLADLLLNRQVE